MKRTQGKKTYCLGIIHMKSDWVRLTTRVKYVFFAVKLKVFKKVQETLQSLNSTTVCFVGEINRKLFTYRNIFLKVFLYLICWLHTTKINLTEEVTQEVILLECAKCVWCASFWPVTSESNQQPVFIWILPRQMQSSYHWESILWRPAHLSSNL